MQYAFFFFFWSCENKQNKRLNGTIPQTIGALTNLQKLILPMNDFVYTYKTIPKSINFLLLMKQLNSLSGSIPKEIGNLKKLREFNLNTNKLSLLFFLGRVLCMKCTSLTGTIPSKIGNMINLTLLIFGANKLNGTIPPEIGNLTKLHFLDLSENRLSGIIPNEIENLVELNSLLLNQNGLIGTIPAKIGNFRNLSVLELSRNGLSGTIPSEIGNLNKLIFLVLEQNELSGTIPKEIVNLWNLQYLMLVYFVQNKLFFFFFLEFLCENRLSGELPQLNILPFLKIVEVNSNMLSGTIPFDDSYNWDNLVMFSLEKNMFSGNLPKLPNQMNFTLILTLHMNRFSDHNLHDWYMHLGKQ
ncbi:hypothetical protein RFI_01199 [Reticulomyxa filosa]|uniref:Uncharacterized protein n=1 Tax=Reticulomyxa filosa TaxID=46433 RepID=X6PCQ4_RETFI|nr:hypothetical protein RFI_01199 [Reticulomyxa filosa]|eukprot:ETO35863.1 hypothetical protein RFI_01199 [Reticulomyxa filosa]